MHIEELVKGIKAPSYELGEKLQKRLDNLTKPRGSLGRLEEMAKLVGIIQGTLHPQIKRKVSFVVAGDHGVAEEGVSAYPQEVTRQMVLNFLRGGAGINVLARFAGSEVIVIDAGVKGEIDAESPNFRKRKIREGTDNFCKGPAMSREEAIESIETGIKVFEEEWEKGKIDLVGVGEMGIANTTSASAITSVITGETAEEVTSRGTGINDEKLKKKIAVVEKAINLNKPDPTDPIDILHKLGGFEIGVMTGIILASCYHRTPVLMDGFISTSSALLASLFSPHVKEYLIASHLSVEKGHKFQLEYLGKKPLLQLDLRLGEGTGAVLGMMIVEAGIRILEEMASFDSAGVYREKG